MPTHAQALHHAGVYQSPKRTGKCLAPVVAHSSKALTSSSPPDVRVPVGHVLGH